MSLADYTPETIEVQYKRTTLKVRGLSITDLASMLRTHMDDLSCVMELYERSGSDMSALSLANFAMNLIKDAPGLVAHAIAVACDEPELVNKASTLPIMLQINALKAIGTLTFEEVGGVKKLFGEISELLAQIKPVAPTPPANE